MEIGTVVRRALVGRDRRVAAATIALTAVVKLAVVAGTIFSGRTVDAIVNGAPNARTLGLVAAGLIISAAVGWFFVEWTTHRLARNVGVRLQTMMVAHASAWPTSVLAERSAGELTDRTSSDVDSIVTGVSMQFLPTIAAVVGTVAATVGAFTIDWRLALLFVLEASLVIAVGREGVREMAAGGAQLQGAWADAAGVAEEAMSARVDLRQLIGRPFFARRWNERSEQTWAARRAYTSAVIRLRSKVYILSSALQLVVLVVGASAAIDGTVEPGMVWAAVAVTGVFNGQIRSLLYASRELALLMGALGRVSEVLSQPTEFPPETDDPDWNREPGNSVLSAPVVAPQAGSGELFLRRLSAGYDGSAVLHHLDLTVGAGEHLAVIGRTGSGKSTLGRALGRQIQVPADTVFLDGTDITRIDVRLLRRHVIVMPQRHALIDDTLFHNVSLYDPRITRDEVTAVFTELGVNDWLTSVGGLDARPGRGGSARLSSGEIQLVAFARLLVRSPAVVVMDEATASLDPATESRVHEAATRVLSGRTALIIAHRLSTIDEVDTIVVLEDGHLVERGDRAALLADPTSRYAIARQVYGDRSSDESASDPVTRRVADETGVRPSGPQSEDTGAPSPEKMARQMFGRWRRFGLLGASGWYVNLAALTAAAWLWTRVINELRPGGQPGPYLALFAALALIELTGAVVGEQLFTRWWNLVNLRMRGNVFRSQLAPAAPDGCRPSPSPGEVVGRTYDMNESIGYADNYADVMAWTVIVGAFIVAGVSGPSWVLVLPLAVTVAAIVLARHRITAIADELAHTRSVWTGRAANLFAASATVKAYAAEGDVVRMLTYEAADRGHLMYRRERLGFFITNLMKISVGISIAWVLWSATNAADDASPSQRALAAGGAVALIEVSQRLPEFGVILIQMINRRASVRIRLSRGQAMLQTGDELLGEYPESERVTANGFRHRTPDASPPPTIRSAGADALRCIELRGMAVAPSAGMPIAEPVDLSVHNGEMVVLTGPVGSGKTFVLEVLAGLRPVPDDVLWWNGEAVRHPFRFLRPPLVAFVPQVPALVSGTLRDNVTLDYDRDALAALRLAQFDLCAEVPDGLESIIGHRGMRLSGGQVQRVATARALAVDAELTIVDDLSSALDGSTEEALWRALRADGRTVIASSHSPVAMALADRVIRLRPL